MNIPMILFLSLLIIVILVIKYFSKGKDYDVFKDDRRPTANLKPSLTIDNDKQILIENAKPEEITKAVTEFCNAYNKKEYQAIVKIEELEGEKFLLTFPYNIEFIIYCFLINYLYYPFGIEYSPDIKAWTTTFAGEEGVDDAIVGKKIFLFLPDNLLTSDNVYLTTEDNLVYKIDFGGFRNALNEINDISIGYIEPPVISTVDLNKCKIIF